MLFTLLTEGVDLERLGDGGVFSILDTVSEALTRLDLAGENKLTALWSFLTKMQNWICSQINHRQNLNRFG